MQTTLLGLSIAIILALVAALVGPHFIDWTDYRAAFEARASRIVGMPVNITGKIEARLLPTPWLTLHAVEGTEPTGEPRFKVREVGIELALGPLLRGEWRASEIHLIAPQIGLGLDGEGRIDWTGTAAGIDPEVLTIERLSIEQGRVTLADKASASWLSLDKLSFSGELRSLIGPFKGEGSFNIRGAPHAYKLTGGRKSPDGSMRIRLAVETADDPFSADAEGTLRFEQGSPGFEGNLTLARQSRVALADGRAISNPPWRVTSHIKLASAGAAFDQLEVLYGADERAVKLGGTAELGFGHQPRLEAVLSARQLDLDRFVALPEGSPRLPSVVLRAAAEAAGASLQVPLPLRLALSIDQMTLGEGTVQSVRGDVSADEAGWQIAALEFRAPGSANVRASGRVTPGPNGGIAFSGPATIEASDPKALAAWLEGRITATSGTIAPLRANGQLTLATDRLAVDQLRAEIDNKAIAGRLAYAWVTETQRPRLEAELNAAELDIDATIGLIKTALPDASFDIPGELSLSLDLGRATVAGVQARTAKAKLKLDPSGLAIERLTVGDLAGAAVELSGRVQAPWSAPRGTLTLDLSGNRLDGVAALLERIAPALASPLRSVAPQLAPAKLRVGLGFEPLASAGAAATSARLRVEGTAGALRIALTAESSGDPKLWQQAATLAEGRIEAPNGVALLRLFGLDTVVAPSPGPATLRWSASGPAGGELAAEARLAAVGTDIIAKGSVRLFGESGPSGTADVSATALDAVALRPLLRRADQPGLLALKTALSFSKDRVVADQLTGSVGDTTLSGRLVLNLGAPLRLEGRLEADTIDAAALLAAFAGMPAEPARGRADTAWPAAPFNPRFLDGVTGQVDLAAARAPLTPALDIRRFRAVLRMSDAGAALEEVQGTLAGGRLLANVTLQNSGEGTAATVRLGLTGAELAALAPAGSRAIAGGRVNLQLDLKGGGRTPAAFAGTLGGSGTLSIERVELAGFDPQMFVRLVHAADEETGIDPARVKSLVERAIDAGRLRIGQADGALSVVAGQLRLANMIARGEGADLSVSGSIDLVKLTVDARLTLQGAVSDGAALGRPEIDVALKGPVAAPQRSIDVSNLVGWLTLRSVEQQAKRLEEAEKRAAEAAAAARARPIGLPAPGPGSADPATGTTPPAAAPANPRANPPPVAPPPRPSPDAPSGPTAAAPPEAVPPSAAMPPPAVVLPRPPPSVPSAALEQAPALPPPIDVQPAPGLPRANSAGRPPRHAPAARPVDPLPPPPTRSILDLFRW
ncbi:MAG TPA: AsmA family protein [Xanthobacteraceae bacterium]